MKQAHLGALAVTALLSASVALADPVAVGPPTSETGDGLFYHVHTVGVGSPDVKPDNISEAIDLLAATPTNFIVGASFDSVAPYINHGDGDYGSGIAPAQRLVDAGTTAGSDTHASEWFGFLNVATDGSYTFRTYHDDGFRLTLGGEVISSFDGNTGPNVSLVTLDLTGGIYELQFLGWEQGGLYINELSWQRPGDTTFSLIPTAALFTDAPADDGGDDGGDDGVVPEPITTMLLGLGLAAMGWSRRRRR